MEENWLLLMAAHLSVLIYFGSLFELVFSHCCFK